MVIFSMSWRCLNKETLQAYVQKPPSAPGYGVLVQSTQAESFATIEKLKVLLQSKRWKFCYNRHKLKVLLQSQAESSATNHKQKVLLQSTNWKFCYNHKLKVLLQFTQAESAGKLVASEMTVLWGKKTFLFSNEKGFLHVCSHCPYQSMT